MVRPRHTRAPAHALGDCRHTHQTSCFFYGSWYNGSIDYKGGVAVRKEPLNHSLVIWGCGIMVPAIVSAALPLGKEHTKL